MFEDVLHPVKGETVVPKKRPDMSQRQDDAG